METVAKVRGWRALGAMVKAGMAVALGNRALGRSVGATLGVAAVLAGLAWLLV